MSGAPRPKASELASAARVALLAICAVQLAHPVARAQSRLVGRAVLPADTFAPGPTAGRSLVRAGILREPFAQRQPVQGLSALVDNGDGTFLALGDNGFGALENSADARLRLYVLRAAFETRAGGPGSLQLLDVISLRDPAGLLPFTLSESFTRDRYLTGADLDPESMQRDVDGTLWIGDEFGPYLLHFASDGRLLEPPYSLPDFDRGGEIRSPQNPELEEATPVRIMNALQHHARAHGVPHALVCSPAAALVADDDPSTHVRERAATGTTNVAAVSSEIFDVRSLRAAGYPVVPYTVNDPVQMAALLRLGVSGLISDRPDLLYEVARDFDADRDGRPGDLLTADGLIDVARFDAQGHRGARDLRPENTLPAMEAALDALVTTLETDTVLSADGVPLLAHEPEIDPRKCRRVGGKPLAPAAPLVIASHTARDLQSMLVCDGLSAERPLQRREPARSPVALEFAAERGFIDLYVPPTVDDLFAFVEHYARYYAGGRGAQHPRATQRARNARRVRFNLEIKRDARVQSFDPRLGSALLERIVARDLTSRVVVQSFDFRTLLALQAAQPSVRTAYLFGDPTNLAPPRQLAAHAAPGEAHALAALAGLRWPYRITSSSHPVRAGTSAGFEGLAIDRPGRKLYAILERPLQGAETLQISEFDIDHRRFTGVRYHHTLDPRAVAIGDFALFSARSGLIVERDDSEGTTQGYKALVEVILPFDSSHVERRRAIDLLAVQNPHRLGGLESGAVGLGDPYTLPFSNLESVVVLSPAHVAVVNDNNYPKSKGRRPQEGRPDDSELVILRLDEPLTRVRLAPTLQGVLDHYLLE